MRKFKILLAFCALTSTVFFSGIALAQDSYVNQEDNAQQIADVEKESNAKQQIVGFGTGTGFGSGGGFGSSTMVLDGFGGSMSSRGSMNVGHGFGTGFDPGTGSGPMSAGGA